MTVIENLLVDPVKKRFAKFGFSGMLCMIVAYMIVYFNPLQIIADDMLTIREGTYAFNLFKTPPLDVYVSVYVFNVSNADQFLSGEDEKLKLDEVGPFTFREVLTHHNITFHPNGTMSYIPHREVAFVPDRSIGTPTDLMVTVPNIVMLGASTLASDLSFFAALGVSTIVKTTSATPFVTVSAQDFLWGYDDPLISLASTVVPTVVPFKKFGLLDRMFDDGVNVVTINLPEGIKQQKELKKMKKDKVKDIGSQLSDFFVREEDSEEETDEPEEYEPLVRDYSIDMWNGSPGLYHWGWTNDKQEGLIKNTGCNTLRGNYDGVLFPKNISKNEVFKYYRKCFCRTMPIVFTHEGQIDGIQAYWFKLADYAFESKYDDPETSCYCKKQQCLKRGLGNITPCYWNIPIAVSLPHFYNSDPTLLDEVAGMKPDEEKHGAIIALQPKLGIPMKVKSRVQINLLMGGTRFNSKIERFQNKVIPLIWAEISVDKLSDSIIALIKMLFLYLPYVQLGIAGLIFVLGVLLFAVALRDYMCMLSKPCTRKKAICDAKANAYMYTMHDVRRYSAAKIHPLIGCDVKYTSLETLKA